MNGERSRTIFGPALGVVMALVSAGIANQIPNTIGARASASGARAQASHVARAASGMLERLEVADEGSRQGYRRDKFRLWITHPDGCTTRQQVLIDERIAGDVKSCSVIDGEWISLYDGKDVTNARLLDIDHMVPLAEAWDSGASGWTAQQRTAYANDLDFDDALIAVSQTANRAKGDKDPAEWRPPDKDSWCRYATAWAVQKIRWKLTADQAEVDALRDMLDSCTTPAVFPSTLEQ